MSANRLPVECDGCPTRQTADEWVRKKNMETFWRWICVSLLAAIGGLITGQYMPNRSVVTIDQLVQINSHLDRIDASIADTRQEVKFVRGEVEAKHRLSD